MARPRTFDETAVVEAARDRFWTSGYSATSLDDLVEATGLARGSLYNAFGDKHTLYVRAFESYCAEAVAGFSRGLDGPDGTAAERLRKVVHRMADTAGTDSAPPVACFLAKATAELAALDPEVAAIARRTFQQLEDALVRCVTAARRAGAVPESADPRATARHILVALRGMEALAAAGVDRAVLADAAASLTESVLGSRR
jgi:TetR/AcrR family transcriptional regulator, transcriptional repressor for nem operon